MPTLKTNRDFQPLQKLPFCYLCEQEFCETRERTRDHVVPRAIFATDHQICPLILPAHRDCNESQSVYDERIGQFLAVLHGKYPPLGRVRLDIRAFQDSESGSVRAACVGIDLRPIVFRWIRGFHAALYTEHLPVNCRWSVHPPIPYSKQDDPQHHSERLLDQQAKWVAHIKRNRTAGSIDSVECFDGHCVYHCCWDQCDRGEWICIFAMKILDWEVLADPSFPRRCCAGFYQPPAGRPCNGTTSTRLQFDFLNTHPLDAFTD